jgi:hypothetical protein
MSDAFIRTATAADAERCLAALTLAFSGDPPCRWAWPDAQQYLEAFPMFARAFGGGAIDHGTAQVAGVAPAIRRDVSTRPTPPTHIVRLYVKNLMMA